MRVIGTVILALIALTAGGCSIFFTGMKPIPIGGVLFFGVIAILAGLGAWSLGVRQRDRRPDITQAEGDAYVDEVIARRVAELEAERKRRGE